MQKSQGGGGGGCETLSFLLAVLFAVAISAAFPAQADVVVDLDGATITYTDSSSFGQYVNKELQNGTINLNSSQQGSAGWTEGTYTIGSGAIVNCEKQAYFNNTWTLNLIDGGEFNMTSSGEIFYLPFRNGNVELNLSNGGKFTSAADVWIGGLWNNKSQTDGKNNTTKFVMTGGSTLSLASDKSLKFGTTSSTRKAKTVKNDIAITNSFITLESGQIILGESSNGIVSDTANSYTKITFGPGSEITTGQIYADGPYPSPYVTFDGATIHWNGKKSSFIGHRSDVGDVYEIQSNDLTIDIPSGKSLTCDQNASSLKGEGGITKTGEGSITWNKVSSNGSQGMTFTGPLTVTEGTWSSSLGYASKVFNVSGEGSVLELSGALSADEINFNVSEGGLLKLTGATTPNDTAPDMSISAGGVLEDVSTEPRTFSALALGEGCAVKVAGGADGVVGILADQLALSATEENRVTLKFSSASEIPVGTYAVIMINGEGAFSEGDDKKFSFEETVPENSQLTLSEDKKSLLLIVPATNPATWTGNAGDGKFSTKENWLGGKVPGEDDEIDIKAATDIELECDTSIAVKAISIHPESAKVTINGAGSITLSEKIVNASEKMMTVNVPVEFKTGENYAAIDVTGEVAFQDEYGVTGTIPVNHTTFYGNYTLKASSWDVSKAFTLAENATVSAGSTTINTSGTELLNSKAGSTLIISRLNLNVSGNIFGTFAGNLTVNYIYQYNHGGVSFNSGFSGVLRVNGIHHHSGSSVRDFAFKPDSSATIIIGGGSCGIEMQRGYFQVNGYTFHSAGNWEFDIINSNYGGDDRTGRTVIGEKGIIVDTSHYGDPTLEGHTVSVNNSSDRPAHIAVIGTGGMTAIGNGTFKFNTPGTFTGGFTASDSVTLEVKSGVYPGKGNVTIKDTATLKLVDSASGTVPVAGTLTLEGGATLRIPQVGGGMPLSVNALQTGGDSENKVHISIGNAESLSDGVYTILASNESISDDVLEKLALNFGENAVVPEYKLRRSLDGKSILLLWGNPPNTWIGGSEGNLSEAANWSSQMVPANGAGAVICCASAATLERGEAFAPSSITFSAGCAAVTINGEEAIKGIAAVTNLSSSVQEIACPLEFANNYRVHCSSKSVKFSGGATATYPASDMTDNAASRALTGNIMFTEDWTAVTPMSNKYTVPNGSCVYGKALIGGVDNKTFLCVQNGGYAKFDSILTGKKLGRVSVQGELEVVNQWIAIATDNYSQIGEDNNSSETGVLRAGGLWKGDDTRDMSKILYIKIKELYIGKDGLGAKQNDYYLRFDHDDGHVIHATDDFEIFGPLNSDNPHDWGLHLNGKNITFDTAGHTILWTAGAQGSNGKTVKKGVGTLVMNPHGTTLSCAWSVDEGTLALAKNNATGSGAITVNTGAVLEVPSSTNVALGGDLTLKNGACLGFNYTTRNPPVLNLTDKNVTFEEGESTNIVVKISSSNGKRPYGGVNVLTSGGKFSGVTVSKAVDNPDWVKDIYVDDNGNIVLLAKPRGTRIIVR